MNKRGQFDYPIITVAVVIIGLLIIAPIILKIFHSVQTPISNSFGNVSNGGAEAQAGFNKVMNTASGFWDKVIIAAFIFSVLLLFISAFFIDSSPIWVILYIFVSFFMILFTPTIVDSLSNIYDSPDFALESSQLTFTDFIRIHYGEVLVGLIVITGIIIYGKIAFFPSTRGVR